MNMNDVITHQLIHLPWTLANADDPFEKQTTCNIDGMSLIQKMNGNNKTFAEYVLFIVQYPY